MEKLNILNDNGGVIGEEFRDVIHREGLLHGEVHVWFISEKGELIFQHRAKGKDTYPDLLDATVGGHVDLGETFEQSAVKEVREETGLFVTDEDLKLIATTKSNAYDSRTNTKNNAIRKVYFYRFPVDISSLVVEEGKAEGFEAWSIDTLLHLTIEEQQKFVPARFDADGLAIFMKLKQSV